MSNSFFFVDDSGSKDWETPYAFEFVKNPPARTDANIKFWRENYFVLAGIHISRDAVAYINPIINRLKREFFGTTFIEIKSEWLRNPHQRRRHYLDPFQKNEEDMRHFVEQKWYPLFETFQKDLQIQAFVLDKRFYNSKREKVTPLQETVQVLFDRVELHPNCSCEIVFDQMDSNIRSQKHNHGSILSISRKQLDLHSFQKKYSHSNIRFEESLRSNFLQLADTVAYNVYRQFVEHGDSWEEGSHGSALKGYAFFSKIEKNFYHRDGRISGYGIVKLPDLNKGVWERSV